MRNFLILLFVIIFSAPLMALDAGITVASFKGEKGNYIESDIYVVGRSVAQKQVDSINSVANVEVLINFLQNNKLIKSEKFKIESPRSLDPSDFRDTRRYNLPDGFYDVEVAIFDLNRKGNDISFKTTVQLDYSEKLVRLSDILILSNSSAASEKDKTTASLHNGMKMDILPFQFYGNLLSEMQFYTEIYNVDKADIDSFVFSYVIERVDAKTKSAFEAKSIVQKSAGFVPELIKIDLDKMPSGTYQLSTKVLLKQGIVLNERETFFQRLNLDLDTVTGAKNILVDSTLSENEFVGSMDNLALDYNLKAISMNVATEDVQRFKEIIAGGDIVNKRKFLYLYWIQKNAKYPEQAFEEYMFNARTADKAYTGGSQFGFETDRGRVFMKYGRPTDVMFVDNEENTPAYEVWVFEKLKSMRDTKMKFVFYNPNNVVGNYLLLQSNAANEINNPQWLQVLYKNVTPENLKLRDHHAEELFNKN